MATPRNNASDTSRMNPVYKPKASPAPKPTSLKQLKNVRGTMMAMGETVTAGSKEDPNIYSGTFKGKDYNFSKGKATRSK
jgi:hypothetical protein